MWLSILKAFATGHRELIFLKAHIHGIIGANLLGSQAMSSQEKSLFQQISARKVEKTDVLRSIQFVTLLLNKHYNKKVILLIDEYDVPVATKANNNGYYAEMLDVMKGLMQSLKDNQALRLAVITGSFTIPSMPVLPSLRQSTRRTWEIWRARAMRHCSRLMIECTRRSMRMTMTRFFAMGFRSLRNAAR